MPVTDDQIKQIINGDAQLLVKVTEQLGAELKKQGLTTSQIRNIFGLVKKMEMEGFNAKEFILLKPKLAYAAARPGATDGVKHLKDVLSTAIDAVGSDANKFKTFADFFEAILAYHRAAGGK